MVVDVVELGGVLVEGDDVGAAPVRLEAVPARAAADVDHLGAGTDAEPVEVDGQHGSPLPGVVASRRSRNGPFVDATVCAATDSQLNTSTARAATGRAKALQLVGGVEQFAEHPGQLVDVTGPHQPGALAVGADHLGQRTGAAGDDRCAAGHRLHRGQREPFVQRRDASDFGRGEQIGQFGVGEPTRAVHDVGDAEFGDQLLGRAVGFELGDQLQLEVAFDPQLGHGVQQVPNTLERHVGAGDRDDAAGNPRLRRRCEQSGVDAQRHDMQLVGATPRSPSAMSAADVDETVSSSGIWRATRSLHLREAVPPAHQRLAPPPRGGHVEHPVAGDRVVHGRHHGQAGLGDRQQAGAEALVVVHDVEVVAPVGEQRGRRAG